MTFSFSLRTSIDWYVPRLTFSSRRSSSLAGSLDWPKGDRDVHNEHLSLPPTWPKKKCWFYGLWTLWVLLILSRAAEYSYVRENRIYDLRKKSEREWEEIKLVELGRATTTLCLLKCFSPVRDPLLTVRRWLFANRHADIFPIIFKLINKCHCAITWIILILIFRILIY